LADTVFTYLVTSYHESGQLYRLLERLRRSSPDARLLVSHDRKAPPLDAGRLASVTASVRLTSEPITWGDRTYLHSLLEGIAAAAPSQDDWITVITGQCYPVRPLAVYEHHLSTCSADALLEVPDSGDPHEAVLARRYLRRYYDVPNWLNRHTVARIVNRLPLLEFGYTPRGAPSRISRPRLRSPFGPQFALHRGGDLFALNGRAARSLDSSPPDLLRYFDRTSVPSEAYVQTVLFNDPSIVCRPESTHYTRWEASSHPEWLGVEDLPAMVRSGAWFARKFQPDASVLDHLDRRLDADDGDGAPPAVPPDPGEAVEGSC
jgi:hypothetical protein